MRESFKSCHWKNAVNVFGVSIIRIVNATALRNKNKLYKFMDIGRIWTPYMSKMNVEITICLYYIKCVQHPKTIR